MGWAKTMGGLVEVLLDQNLSERWSSGDPRIDENRRPRLASFTASDFDELGSQDQLAGMIEELRQAAGNVTDPFAVADIDTLAWYQQAHFFPDNPGIYVLTSGVQTLAVILLASLPTELRNSLSSSDVIAIVKHAWQLLVIHETFHHSMEIAVAGMELVSGRSLYRAGQLDPEICQREEALATSRMLAHRVGTNLGGKAEAVASHLNCDNPLWLSAMPITYQNGQQFVRASTFSRERSSLRNQYLRRSAGNVDMRGLVEFPSSVADLSEQTFMVWYEDDDDALSSVMSRVSLNCKEAIRMLQRNGFTEKKGGKHRNMEREDGTKLPVPCHGGRDLSIGVVQQIAKLLGVSVEKLARM